MRYALGIANEMIDRKRSLAWLLLASGYRTARVGKGE